MQNISKYEKFLLGIDKKVYIRQVKSRIVLNSKCIVMHYNAIIALLK